MVTRNLSQDPRDEKGDVWEGPVVVEKDTEVNGVFTTVDDLEVGLDYRLRVDGWPVDVR